MHPLDWLSKVTLDWLSKVIESLRKRRDHLGKQSLVCRGSFVKGDHFSLNVWEYGTLYKMGYWNSISRGTVLHVQTKIIPLEVLVLVPFFLSTDDDVFSCPLLSSPSFKLKLHPSIISTSDNHVKMTLALRKIDGTGTVPLGHRLMVRKTVPFGALFWCPLGHYFGALLQKVQKGHRFGSVFFLSAIPQLCRAGNFSSLINLITHDICIN